MSVRPPRLLSAQEKRAQGGREFLCKGPQERAQGGREFLCKGPQSLARRISHLVCFLLSRFTGRDFSARKRGGDKKGGKAPRMVMQHADAAGADSSRPPRSTTPKDGNGKPVKVKGIPRPSCLLSLLLPSHHLFFPPPLPVLSILLMRRAACTHPPRCEFMPPSPSPPLLDPIC